MKKRDTSDPINARPINAKDFAAKYADRVRHGKTARDKARKKGE